MKRLGAGLRPLGAPVPAKLPGPIDQQTDTLALGSILNDTRFID